MRIILSIAAVLVSVGHVSGMGLRMGPGPDKSNSAKKPNNPPTAHKSHHSNTKPSNNGFVNNVHGSDSVAGSAEGPGAGNPHEPVPAGLENHSHMRQSNTNTKTHMVNNPDTSKGVSSVHSETAPKTRRAV